MPFRFLAKACDKWQDRVGENLLSQGPDLFVGNDPARSHDERFGHAINTPVDRNPAFAISARSGVGVSQRVQPFGRITSPAGDGYALDLGLALAHEPSGLTFELAVNDLAGQMAWRDLPRNVETFNNANKFFDANGFVQFNPITTRTSSFANTVQTLDPKAWLSVSYPWSQWRFQAGASVLGGQWLPQLDVKYSFNANWQLTAQYDSYFKTYGLLLQHSYFQIGIRADQFNPDSAKAMGVFLSLNLPLD